ncbi:MAG: hypothetical protein DCC68_25065 [Planctomycetota bacterium]|nr:MAG: hypothetical protein DCC68_25065 [Planctomycetota bacterium]
MKILDLARGDSNDVSIPKQPLRIGVDILHYNPIRLTGLKNRAGCRLQVINFGCTSDPHWKYLKYRSRQATQIIAERNCSRGQFIFRIRCTQR